MLSQAYPAHRPPCGLHTAGQQGSSSSRGAYQLAPSLCIHVIGPPMQSILHFFMVVRRLCCACGAPLVVFLTVETARVRARHAPLRLGGRQARLGCAIGADTVSSALEAAGVTLQRHCLKKGRALLTRGHKQRRRRRRQRRRQPDRTAFRLPHHAAHLACSCIKTTNQRKLRRSGRVLAAATAQCHAGPSAWRIAGIENAPKFYK
jgi:hypothetical protein